MVIVMQFWICFKRAVIRVGEKIDSPMHRDSLFNDSESILSLFFSRIWHVCALETIAAASLHRICAVSETRVHCLTVCAFTRRVFFRYAFIYAVWNAVLLDARNSRTNRLSRALCVCLSWSSIAAAVKCTCILMYTQSVMFSEQDKRSDMWK